MGPSLWLSTWPLSGWGPGPSPDRPAATPYGPQVADQFQGNWLGVTHREFTCPTTPGGPCHPTGHGSKHRPTSGFPMGNIHEVGWEVGGYPQVPTLWIPQPIGSPRVSSSLERPISSLDYTQNYQANIFNWALQDLKDTSHWHPFPPSMAGEGWLYR